MLWLKTAVLSVFVIISAIRGNPVDTESHNSNVEETKFKPSKVLAKEFMLAEPTTYRLPNDSIPISYDITLTTNIHSGNLDFTGNVKIHVRVVEATQQITLHYREIEIKKVDIWETNAQNPIATNVAFEYIESHDFLVIALDKTYEPNNEFILDIDYAGKLRDDGAGFYWGTYQNEGTKKWYGATQFEINDARHAMPCYDEPGIRAVMTLTIIHDKSYTAIANTNVDDQTESGNYFITKFKPTPVMQTYLLAFAISDYAYINATESRIPQRIFGTPMVISQGHGDFAASVVGPVLHKLEEVLKVNYPLDKMDHIALTKFNFGAMENFGLITYIDRGLLLNPALSESGRYNQENSVTSLVAHEYAHQWFGNIISPQWWQYTWLNEGFATLFANYIPHLLNPERNIMNSFFTSTMPTAFNNDRLGSWAMNHYTELPNELWSKFGGIGYQKSGCVLRMFMEVMTPAVFLNGLTNYLQENYMKAATPAQLHKGLQDAYNTANPGNLLDIGTLMYTWENQPGYPLISVSVYGNYLVFSQRRYPSSDDEVYSVPITLATKSNPDFVSRTPKTWLHVPATSVPQASLQFNSNDWIVLNIDQVGYYRVDYDTPLWRAIIGQLNLEFSIINPINRAVLQDEFNMAWTEFGRVTGSDTLGILSYFDKEIESITWGRAQKNINILMEHLFGTIAYEKLLEMLQRITKPHVKELGYEGFDGEIPNRLSLRSYTKLYNCAAMDGDCFIHEYQKLNSYLNGGDPNFNFCYALRLVDENVFTQILNGVASNNQYGNRDSFIRNLGCSLSTDNLDKLLEAVLNSGNAFTNAEREFIINGIYRNSQNGLIKILSFITANYEALSGKIPDVYELMYNIASNIHGNKMTSRFKNILNILVSAKVITNENHETILQKLNTNNKWIEANYDSILDYFEIEEEEEETTIAPTTTTTQLSTTTDSSSSIVLSFGLVVLCIILNLL